MPKPSVIAHRGVRNEIPENTLLSISEALALPNVLGVEFDVELADVPCVLHQETMSPNRDFTALELADRDYQNRDWVGQSTYQKISQLDAGSWLAEQFRDVRVPLLGDVLSVCNWQDKTAFMELKDPTYWGKQSAGYINRMVNAVTPLVDHFEGELEIISFNPTLLAAVLERCPKRSGVLALWTEWQDQQNAAIAKALDVNAGTISLSENMVIEKPDWVDRVKSVGLSIHTYPLTPARNEHNLLSWTPDKHTPIWDQLIELEVDAIISDFPRELLRYIARD